MFAEILIEYGVKSLDKTFTYIVPENLENELKKGMKVKVPFANKKVNGFVLKIIDNFESDYELKEIDSIENEEFVLNDELLEMGLFLKSKTLCNLITSYQTMLPSSLKVKDQKTNYKKYDSYIVLNVSEKDVYEYIESNTRSKKQNDILEALLIDHAILKKSISSSSLETLLKKGLVKIEKEQKYRLDAGFVESPNRPKLTEEQEKTVNRIKESFGKNETFLVHGVTGSGKTEVYMSLIEEAISLNKTAIMLVPEISLTTQIVNRFYDRFGNIVAIFHSALSVGEKYDEYLKILRGEAKIVIGTRSSIFVPLQNLGLILIDEEHSENYKQENNPRYHAIDMAKFRSDYNNIPLVLGSATPSLESMARAKKGVYTLLEMKNRVGLAVLPNVELVNMEEEMKKGNMIFSDTLSKKIEERLGRKEQIILLLNRRGFSTFITCQNCGFTYKCPHCDISLTYHKTSNNLRCHYCGYTKYKDSNCPECNKDSLNYLGLGTEKLEKELKEKFSQASVVRMDADTTKTRGSHAKIIDDFQEHKYDILLGTQMISKGLDFPKVSLVGVINADTTLNIPDFRSGERTFQLLSQVSGRAGRSELVGEVVIQTFNPDNYTLKCVRDNDYLGFYDYEMKIRHQLDYPPYYYLISIRIVSKDYDLASKHATKVGNYLRANLDINSVVLGPTTANMFKINNYYRFQLMIKYKKDDRLFEVLKELDNLFIAQKNVSIEIDCNPSRI